MEDMDSRHSNGQFKAGHGGFKPKGSVNEFQATTRDTLGEFLKTKLCELPTIYETLSNRDKAKLLLAVSEFFLPKTKEIYFENAADQKADLGNWTEEDLRTLIALHDKYEIRN